MSDLNKQRPTDDAALIQAGYRYALSLTHDQHDAEDLIQQACLRVFKLKGKLGEKSYLFITIRNLCIDRWRNQQRQATQQLGEHDELPDTTTSHIDVVNARMDLEQLLSCLRFEEREVLFLNCVEGYSATEIGKITGKPRGTILSLLSRVKQKLNAQYGAQKEVQNAE